jgi:hypothetical protein
MMVTSPKFTADMTTNDANVNEILDYEECYYDHLDPQHNYTVYSVSGGGYLNFMYVLSTVDLTKFDRCIIQETFDPRTLFHRKLKYTTRVRNNIELNIPPVNKAIDDVLKIEHMAQHICQASVTQCNHILKKANIPTVAFAFSKPGIFLLKKDWEHTWIKHLDIPCIWDLYFFKEKYHNFDSTSDFEKGDYCWFGHLTKEGNKQLGVRLRDALDKS